MAYSTNTLSQTLSHRCKKPSNKNLKNVKKRKKRDQNKTRKNRFLHLCFIILFAGETTFKIG